ncbi:MAG: purine-nucleoside phosphorylase [Nitriliruptor sp.]|uniref:purine-nucleoside phosphorylase n=1 Tax=Nitriliruptor sp. TaxID=2448056 RepID=UPI0034A09FD9
MSNERTTAALRARLDGREPEVLLTLGSGLGGVADAVEDAVVIDVLDLPGTAASTVPGHTARLVCGKLAGREVLVQAGRIHLYEGHSAHDVTRLVRVAAQLGVSTFVVTNAAGGIVDTFTPGDLMVIDDHLNLTGTSPLTGLLRDGAPRFVDMAGAYDAALRELAHEVAGGLGLTMQRGVYAGLVGPTYETPAEVAMLRTLGAHAVGMSTVNEVIAARDEGLRVLGFSSVTNVHGEGVATSHAEVIEVGARAAQDLERVLFGVLERSDEAS